MIVLLDYTSHFYILQKSSPHLFLGIPLSLFLSTRPLITFPIRLPWFSVTLSFHHSVLFTCVTTASCFNILSSFLHFSHSPWNLVTLATLLKTVITIACSLILSLSLNIHASQPYTRVGTTTACIVNCQLGLFTLTPCFQNWLSLSVPLLQ